MNGPDSPDRSSDTFSRELRGSEGKIDNRDDSLVDQLLDQLISRIEENDATALEDLCSKYPSHSEQLRKSARALEMLLEVNRRAADPAHASLPSAVRAEDRELSSSSKGTVRLPEEYDLVGRIIGNYKIRERLGEGGFGVVYVAEQLEPIRRKVAFKVIKLGMDSREVLARFDAERQALALMDHPNIAKIFDGGLTEDGRSFFVMELIRGVELTKFCEHQDLPLIDRLKLFRSVCHAVQHAHHKGIIHRDLKPSNVLVTMHDDHPVVKVIDFGVAKALHTRLTEQSIYTAFGQLVGTPLYMSPEQIQLNELDVDTRSDVFSLGAMLYELVTGSLPFSRDTLIHDGLESFRRLVCDSDPLRPSQRLSSDPSKSRASVVDGRVSVFARPKALTSELDWIVMKALEKDRTRRFQSAGDLAEDIQRFIDGDTVEACPPSLTYRLGKFARRNSLALVASMLLVFVLLLGSIGTTYQAVRAARAEREALQLAETAQRNTRMAVAAEARARLQASKAVAERERADRRTEFARRAVDRMYVDFASDWLNRKAALTDIQKEFLQDAMNFYGQLSSSELATAESKHAASVARFRYASILLKLGRRGEAIAPLEQARAGFQSLSDAGGFPAARSEFAVESNEPLIHASTSVGFQEALLWNPIGSQVVALRTLGLASEEEQSLDYFRRAAVLADQLEASQPNNVIMKHYVGVGRRLYAGKLVAQHQFEEAKTQIQKAVNSFEYIEPMLASNNYFARREGVWIALVSADLASALANEDENRRHLEEAERRIDEALDAVPTMVGYLQDRSIVSRKLASYYEKTGSHQATEAQRLKFADAQILLADAMPYHVGALNNGAWFMLLRTEASAKEIEKALQLARLACDRELSATCANTLAYALHRMGEFDEAVRWYEKALSLDVSEESRLLNHAMLALTRHAQGNRIEAIASAKVVQELIDRVRLPFDQRPFASQALTILSTDEIR